MARTALTAVNFPNATTNTFFPLLPITAGSQDLSFVAGDAINNNVVAITSGHTFVDVFNSHATTTFSLSIHSVADASNRTGDVGPYPIPAQKVSRFGPFTSAGWNQSSPAGLWLDPTSTWLGFCVTNTP